MHNNPKDEKVEKVKEDLENKKEDKDTEKDFDFNFENEQENPTNLEIESLMKEKEELSKELEDLKDKLARMAAEYDNYRKRTAKEKEGIYTDACADVLKELLPVKDNLERAVEVDGKLEDLKTGVNMTIRQFKDGLEKLGVDEIVTDGEFDPKYHNAVMHIEDKEYDKNVIVEVFQKGYKKGNKILRYSMVKVAN